MKLGLLRAQSDELLHLDALRFLACAGIVFHHSHEFFYSNEYRAAATNETRGLALFVDLFFFISGVVISHVYSQRVASASDIVKFMKRRIFRLVPLHWVTLVCAILFWFLITRFATAAHGPAFDPVCIADTALLLHAVVPCGNAFNGQSWSISAEMVAYLFFPILAFLCRKWRAAPFAFCAIAIAIAVSISSFSLQVFKWESIYEPLRALISFSFGVGVWNYRANIKIPYAKDLVWVGFVLMVVLMLNGAHDLFVLTMVYVVGILAVIGDTRGESPGRLVQAFAPLGQLTYSIYMWHGLVIIALLNALGDKILHLDGIPAVSLAILTYVIILVIGYLSLKFIEAPARYQLENMTFRRATA